MDRSKVFLVSLIIDDFCKEASLTSKYLDTEECLQYAAAAAEELIAICK